ncbi:Bromodomain and WD repeat-containing-like protein [Daphnia magna]|uniref:Bromodomain and WD repeat-containing-like protein n=2 Tax=Daphnia magna TaxID=35525 RepID=A0A164ZKK5_9CRUS|nr:hypothetical protein OUZ56_012954 [Daphnia magna]KZS16471.1 Bromodomain and WD repeat-containing-like protein [Daphnia magna]
MDSQFFTKASEFASSLPTEIYVLIAQILNRGPSRKAAEVLYEELEILGMVQKRIEWLGQQHYLTYDQLCQTFLLVCDKNLLMEL